jgi:hypothetical protein
MEDLERCEEIVVNSQKVLLKEGMFTYAVLVKKILESAGISLSGNFPPNLFDASEDLFSEGISIEQIQWVQRYVARAIINRKSTKAFRDLSRGEFLEFDDDDANWAVFAVKNATLICNWIDRVRVKDLLLESLLVHWVSAKR